MATRTWNKERAGKRIDARMAELPARDVEIKEYVRDTDLRGLPTNVAYRVDGVHLYADILNMAALLNVTDYEGEMCHKRTLRFLNLHYRAVSRILDRTEAIFVDFHNQRLHSVVVKPYDGEAARVRKAGDDKSCLCRLKDVDPKGQIPLTKRKAREQIGEH